MNISARIPCSAISILLCAFCMVSPSSAAPVDEDVATLVRENSAKADKLFREMADLGRYKKHNEITNHYAQIAALLSLKEGAPANATPYRLHMETARALCTPLHLHWAGLAAQHYAEALKSADTPKQKAEAIFAAGRLEYDVAANDDPAPALAKIRSALAVPGLSKADLLDLVLRYPTEIDPSFDKAAEAWKIAENEPELHGRYYEGILPAARGQNVTLDPSQSAERTLEICRKALEDPAVTGGRRMTILHREIDALLGLGRNDEAEQRILSLAATTDPRARATWCRRLGEFYVERARRYYLPSHEPTLRKALAAYTDANLADPRDTRTIDALCSISLGLKDYWEAERAVARQIELDKGATNVWARTRLGRIAYGKGDYAAAASAFGSAEEKLEVPDRLLYARSLKVLGRIAEAVAQLEKVEKVDNRFRKSTDRFYIQHLKQSR